MSIIPVVLAAGQGTRMKSALPKVLHPVLGKPMIIYILDEIAKVTPVKPVVVVGHGAEQVENAINGKADIAVQRDQLGTADAVLAAEPSAAGKADYVIVCYSDMPCLQADTIQKICNTQIENTGVFSMLTIIQDDSHGFGRIIRHTDETVAAIVEEAQATPEQLKIKECNVGLYCFQSEWLWQALKRVKISPKGEYYLTDLVELANEDHQPVQAVILDDLEEALGVNNRVHLSEAESIMRKRINRKWMMEGITMVDPNTTYIGADVRLDRDTFIYPDTWIEGKTIIGKNCTLGPGTFISDSMIGSDSIIQQSCVKKAALPKYSRVGPFETIGS
ncbi:MAG: NTP transferase domain-containing protein [Flexilinea sp.]